jgi:hypothetical protein
MVCMREVLTDAAAAIPPWNHALVTVMPEIGELHVTTPDSVPLQPTVQQSSKEAATHAQALTAMYLAAGPGEHSLRYLSRHARLPGLTAASEAIRLAGLLPEDVVSYGLSGDGREVVRFGAIAIAGRRPTDPELEQYAERVTTPPPLAERRRDEALMLDQYKIDLTGFDHVSIRIGDRMMELQLDSPLTLLASRVLGKLSHLPEADLQYSVDVGELARNIWDCMPLTERSLYTSKDADLFGPAR